MRSGEGVRETLENQRVLDRLAAIEHQRWAHWQRHLHDQCTELDDGSLVIPAELVRRWDRQISTPYDNLAPEEKRSDQEQVMNYLPTIISALSQDSRD